MTSELKYTDGIPFAEVRLLNTEDCFTEDLSTTLKPEQGFVEFTFCFKDGTSATFKDAGSLQEFLDRLAKFHELEQQLIQTKQDLEIATSALYEICNDYQEDSSERAEKALEQIEHKD